jgi:hypothetical protein
MLTVLLCKFFVQIADDLGYVVPRQALPGIGDRRVLDSVVALWIVLVGPRQVAECRAGKPLRDSGLNNAVKLELNEAFYLTPDGLAHG